MARNCLFAREAKRKKLCEKYKKIREEMKKNGDYVGLQTLPKNSSPIRQHNRCQVTGRARGFHRKFGISRLVLREKGLKGEIPGLKKASW